MPDIDSKIALAGISEIKDHILITHLNLRYQLGWSLPSIQGSWPLQFESGLSLVDHIVRLNTLSWVFWLKIGIKGNY